MLSEASKQEFLNELARRYPEIVLVPASKATEMKEERDRYRKALEYGLNVMMPEIHAQRTMWPGEVDEFEDRARAALTPEASHD